jgi:uncharacterized membrane protein YdbT with pleckstrin-like domain
MIAIGQQTKLCPFCAELIHEAAIKCRFCSEILDVKKAKEIQSVPGDAAEKPQKILLETKPSLWGLAGPLIRALLFFALAFFLLVYPLEQSALFDIEANRLDVFAGYRIMAGLGLFIIISLLLFLKALKLKMTAYHVSADRIEWSRGIFDRKVDNIDMFRVVDLKMRRSLFDCIVGIGTVGLITTDKTDPEFNFEKIKHPRRLYDIIKQASLKADREQGVFHVE